MAAAATTLRPREATLHITSRLRASLTWAVAAVLLSFTAAAHAHDGDPIRLGSRVFAELGPGGGITVDLLGAPQTRATLTVAAWRGDTLLPQLALTDPDGLPVALDGVARTLRGGRMVRVRGLLLEKSGVYRLRVTGALTTEGGFNLVTRGRTPGRFRGTGEVTAPGEEVAVPFVAFPGDTSVCTVRRLRGSRLVPEILRYVDGSGAGFDFGGTRRAGPVTAASAGEHRYDVSGEGGSRGAFRSVVRVRKARVPRRFVELTPRAGSISGTILVGGHGAADPAGGAKAARRASPGRPPEPEIRSGELIVEAPSANGIGDVLATLRAAAPGVVFEYVRSLTEHGPHLVRAAHVARRPATRRRRRMTRRLVAHAASRAAVAWCEPNGIVRPLREPNDALFTEQPDFVQLRLPDAWEVTIGDPSIVVAVIDSGIFLTHPDLEGRLLPGHDFVSDPDNAEDGDGWDTDPSDSAFDFHGTHVAGTVGAAANNRSGVSGVIWDASILPVRALGKQGGSFFDLAAALRWSVGLNVVGAPLNANPARVVNMSLGGAFDSNTFRDAIVAAAAQDVVLVAAAGNERTSADSFPAAYPEVMSVAATSPDLRLASYSNFGPKISVAAPGGDLNRGQRGILSTFADRLSLQPTFRQLQGTSMASPHVAGVAGLVLAANPSLTAAEVRSILETTALDLGVPGRDDSFGHGFVDAGAAVREAANLLAAGAVLVVTPQAVDFGPVVSTASVLVRNAGTGGITVLSATPDDGGAGWLAATLNAGTAPTTIDLSVDRGLLPGGLQRGSVLVSTSAGDVTLPVSATSGTVPDLGTLVVQALDASGVAASTTTSLAEGYAYTLEGLAPGAYSLLAFVDRNGNDVVDRVDEWFGIFPVSSDPAVVVVSQAEPVLTGKDFALSRHDASFEFAGAGGGAIDGALAVWAYEVGTPRAVTGTRVYVESPGGVFGGTAVTDANGRAVVTGAFGGRQVVTVVADGYDLATQAVADAQFQSFGMVPSSAPPTFEITLNVAGLDVFDTEVHVQVGETRDLVFYGGAGVPSITLDVPLSEREIPVWALVIDDLGIPTKIVSETLLPVTTPQVLDLDVTAFEPSSFFFELPQTVNLPLTNFTAAGAVMVSEVQLFFTSDDFVPIGVDPLEDGVESTLRWASFGDEDPFLLGAMSLSAFDTLERESHHLVAASLDSLVPPSPLTLLPPATPTFPPDGQPFPGPPGTERIDFQPSPGADLNLITIFGVDTNEFWTVLLPGDATSFTLPDLPERGIVLQPGTYGWFVDSFVIPGLDADDYRDDTFTTTVTDVTSSEVRVFSND